MGCGGSRLGGVAAVRAGEGGVVPLPAGIRPLLRRRLEEMKKRSHASVLKGSQTQSKKELLRHGSSDDGEDTDGSLKSSAKVAPAPDHHVEEKKEVILEKVPSRDDVKEVNEEEVVVKKQEDEKHHQDVAKKQEEDNKEVVKKQEEDIHHEDVTINVKKEGDDGKNHDEDERSIMSNFDERMIGPGSPSFRVYCIDVPSSDDDDEEKDGEDTRKSMEIESSVMTEIKEDGSIVKKEKRERRGKRFGIGLPKKYLANVTAPCYAGGGCMGNTHSRLVQEKPRQ
ncbi:PREDICTED: nuclear polyadenylated RNA-binding protein 3-like [Camelina sativa]|uniref:Nuclear polyadenylated RNA-binding protein 3-like n=2 Tax=Camelina sativa TaxID=90675 RepID=A0ABM0UKQ7_CAMSA|nr:PREDICTED: nuclear polyadenylated RNA-binding protein 3-like [Camelina sativa]